MTASLTPAPQATIAAVTVAPTATPKPTVLTAAQAAAAHITASVTRLMSMSDATSIKAWVAAENTWLDSNDTLPVLRPYVIEFVDVLRQQAFEADTINYSVIVLDIIKAAKQVPGVTLP